MRLLLTLVAALTLGMTKVPSPFPAMGMPDTGTPATGPLAPPVLAVVGVVVTLAFFIVARRHQK